MSRIVADDTAKVIPLDLLDEPTIAMRQTMNPEKMQKLITSIERVGLVQSVVVVARGERFVIAAGHRRYVACRALNHTTIRARVYPEGTALEEAIKLAENSEREDVNPGEEAEYFRVLLTEQCGSDKDKLVELMQVSESYVDARLALLKGDPLVLAALKSEQVGLSVAQELNRFKRDDFRRMALEHAISGGATRNTVARWRAEYEAMGAMIPDPAIVSGGPTGPSIDVAPYNPKCEVCGDGEPFSMLRIRHVHDGVCLKLFDRALQPYVEGVKEG